MRISCPPTISPCFYGVDTPRRSELIAATHTLEEIRKYLDADSVAYLSLEGLTGAVKGGTSSYCTSCYTGVYPVAFPRDEAAYLQLALKLNPEPAAPSSRTMSHLPHSRKTPSSADRPRTGRQADASRRRARAFSCQGVIAYAAAQSSAQAAADLQGAYRSLSSLDYRNPDECGAHDPAPAGGRGGPGAVEAVSEAHATSSSVSRVHCPVVVQRPRHRRARARPAARRERSLARSRPTSGSRRIPTRRWPPTLLTRLQTEQAEFVRPAVVGGAGGAG